MAAKAMIALNKRGLDTASCGICFAKCIAPSLRSYQAGRLRHYQRHAPALVLLDEPSRPVLTRQMLHIMCEQSSCRRILKSLSRIEKLLMRFGRGGRLPAPNTAGMIAVPFRSKTVAAYRQFLIASHFSLLTSSACRIAAYPRHPRARSWW